MSLERISWQILGTVLAVLLAPYVRAQTDFYYDFGGIDEQLGTTQLADGGLVLCGQSLDEAGLVSGVLLTANPDGTPRSTQRLAYDRRTSFRAAAPGPDGGFYAAAIQSPIGTEDDWLIYRCNASGQILESFGYGAPETDEQVRNLKVLTDRSVVLAGNTGGRNVAIVSRIGPDGKEVYRRGFSVAGNRFTFFDGIEEAAADGSIYLSGIARSAAGDDQLFMILLDAAGELVWNNVYAFGDTPLVNAGRRRVRRLPSGELLATVVARTPAGLAGTVLLRLAADGTPLRATQLITPGHNRCGIFNLDGNRLLIPGSIEVNERPAALIVSTDFDFTNPTVGVYDNGTQLVFRKVYPRGDGVGYQLIGRGVECPGGAPDFALIQTGPELRPLNDGCQYRASSFELRELRFTAEPAGTLEPRTDPRIAAPPGVPTTVRYVVGFCPELSLTPARDSTPVCYEGPFRPLTELAFPAGLEADSVVVELVAGNESARLVNADNPLEVELELTAPAGAADRFVVRWTPYLRCRAGAPQELTFNFLPEATGNCCEVYLPTAFSPNEDGVNDFFGAQAAAGGCDFFRVEELIVFDRWGGEVYRGAAAWDGTRAGEALPTGVYVYALTYNSGGTLRREAGEVTLVR